MASWFAENVGYNLSRYSCHLQPMEIKTLIQVWVRRGPLPKCNSLHWNSVCVCVSVYWWICIHVGGIVCGPLPTIARTNVLEGTERDVLKLHVAIQKVKTWKLNGQLSCWKRWRPESWCNTLFGALPNEAWPLQPTDLRLRPIAFVYLTKPSHIFYLEAGRTAWVSARTTAGIKWGWITLCEQEPGPVDGVWPGALACTMEGSCWWGNFWPSRMDLAMRVFWTIGWSRR